MTEKRPKPCRVPNNVRSRIVTRRSKPVTKPKTACKRRESGIST